MNKSNNLNVNNVNFGEEEQVLIKTQEKLTSLLKAVKNGEPVDEKYKSCMKKNSSKPCVGLYSCFRDGFVAKGVIKNVDDIFQYLVFDFGPNHLWSHDNFTDQQLICEVLSLICQPEFSINRIKNFEHRLVAGVFDVDAIKQNKTKYIFNLKEQMALGTVSQENYSNEVRIQDFLLPDSIDDINDLVEFMGYDSENHGNRVLPKMTWWELLFIPVENMHSQVCPNTGESITHHGFSRNCLKPHYNIINDRDLDLRPKRDNSNSGAIKDFDQLKKIVDFPDNRKLPWEHTMFFANSSVKDGVEFLRLFKDDVKDSSRTVILSGDNCFRVFKPGAFSFDNRADIEEFLKTECQFRKYSSICRFGLCACAILVDLLRTVMLILALVLYIPAQIFDDGTSIMLPKKYLFFEYTKKAYGINAKFELVVKRIENNCAAGKQLNNLNSELKSENEQGAIPNLEQVSPIVPINSHVESINRL